MTEDHLAAAARVLQLCRERGWRIGTAESCTGGLVASALTAVPGSSDVVEAGFVTYSNAAKTILLGVPEALLGRFGAVSAEVAAAMAEGVLARLDAVNLAVSVTGIAGPGGGTAAKPVGLVHFGVACRNGRILTCGEVLPGDRAAIRTAAVARALALLAEAAGG